MTMFSKFISKVVGPKGMAEYQAPRDGFPRAIAPPSMRWSGT